MTDAQKAAVLADFMGWSGGFYPDECNEAEITAYVESGTIITNVPEADILDYLLNYGD